MRATEDLPFSFHAMSDHLAAAVRTGGGKRVNRALEAVEDMTLPLGRHFEALVVIISADFTFRHCLVASL